MSAYNMLANVDFCILEVCVPNMETVKIITYNSNIEIAVTFAKKLVLFVACFWCFMTAKITSIMIYVYSYVLKPSRGACGYIYFFHVSYYSNIASS